MVVQGNPALLKTLEWLQAEWPVAGRPPTRVSILGATGRVGSAVFEILAALPGRFDLVAATANHDIGRLIGLIRHVKPRLAVAADAEAYLHLRDMLKRDHIDVGAGDKAMLEAAAQPADIVVVAVPGLAGLPLVLAAAEAGATVVIADIRLAAITGGILRGKSAGRAVSSYVMDPVTAAALFAADAIAPQALERLVLRTSETNGGQPGPADPLSLESFMLGGERAVRMMAIAALRPVEADVIRFDPVASGAVGATASGGERRVSVSAAELTPYRVFANCLTGGDIHRSLDLVESASAPLRADALDESAIPMLQLARELIRLGPLAPAAYCAAHDVVSACVASQQVGVHQVAVVMAETVRNCVPDASHLRSIGIADIEETDVSARLMAYDLLQQQG